MSHMASSSDVDESFDDDYVLQQPNSRLTMTLEAAPMLNTTLTNETIEEASEEESNNTDVDNSPQQESASHRLEAMNAEQINELIDKLGKEHAKSSTSDEENVEGEENNLFVATDEEESTRSGKGNQKNAIKDKKGKKVVKPKIKEEVLTKEVNQELDEEEIMDKKVVKPKRGKKNDETESEVAKTATRSAKSKMTENGSKTKPAGKGRGKPNIESEEENNISKIPSNKRAQKIKEDIQDPNEVSDIKVKPVNKGRGKAKPNHEVEDEPSKVKDTKAKEKTTKVPTNKKEVKAMKETEYFVETENEKKKPLRKTKPTSKEAIGNQESETNVKADGDAEEVSVTRKRAPRKDDADPLEPDVRSDHTNEEPTKKKVGKSKETEKVKTIDEPKNDEKTSKTAKSSKVEKPQDSKKAQDSEPKPRAKKAAAETQPVLPKRSTRNRKV